MHKHRSYIFVAMILSVGMGSVSAQQPESCLHDRSETPAERARRELAIELAHEINRAQAQALLFGPQGRQIREYLSLDQLLNLPATPRGFQVQHLTDGASYAFSIKDGLDPCRYAVFSDQSGDVYEATPSVPEPGFRLLKE